MDACVGESNLHFAFEYVYNSLSDVFNHASGLLPMDGSRLYAHQTLMGLRHLHAHNVVHRDLSLGTILLDMKRNSVKIADLGLAVCASHFVMGRNIMISGCKAPEFVLCADTLNFLQPPIDMWSFANIISALLSGTHLFRVHEEGSKPVGGDVDVDLLQKHIDLLGPPVQSWPSITKLPRWSEYASQLKCEVSGVWTDVAHKVASLPVQRAMSPLYCDLVAGLLQGEPISRLTADQAVSHSVWRLVF